ncbi:glycoside hydrolase family 43 protein [Georgenia faecalis]|uniref:Glycoside hydrolase family 43 protein n=1 Tax=Georgenia faecalis TaxID=2483799 RepID=A0ABV9DBQ8_9MICO|nr:glycoside hydrolase family 43 protein [Georgenia faecalis]
MKTRTRYQAAAVAIGLTLLAGAQGAAAETAPPPARDTNATYYNNAAFDAADPHVLFDEASGYYYAYSTDGATPDAEGNEYLFGIYRSADLATWEHLPGGAIPADEANRWGQDWFWAPSVHHNPETGLYFFFYSARQRENVEEDFGHAGFEEPSKVGVAVSDSPEGPFRSITDAPIDYFPYDPEYRDVNLIMDADQRRPPATLEEGQTAPLGTYIPFIDPDVFFDEDGRIYLYFSRNAYRNWVWDAELGKYIEESNIYAVELTGDWWADPTGTTMPEITPAYVDANTRTDAPAGARRDGYVPVIDYGSDPQAWENAHVDDYATSDGARKDRRWAEGSTTIRREVDTDGDGDLEPVYYLLYSANNWENEHYGVGYATAPSPLGPWTKHAGNPVLAQDPTLPMTGTGHGSVTYSPDGTEAYYVHHGRPAEGPRKLYTSRLHLDGHGVDAAGAPVLVIDQSVSDEPIPSGVAPYTLTVREGDGMTEPHFSWEVTTAAGARLPLDNPLNRVRVDVDNPDVLHLQVTGSTANFGVVGTGEATVTFTYQRQLANGEYVDVVQVRDGVEAPVEHSETFLVGEDGTPPGAPEPPTDGSTPPVSEPSAPTDAPTEGAGSGSGSGGQLPATGAAAGGSYAVVGGLLLALGVLARRHAIATPTP